MAILPYYVANLNIEATYASITGDYLEYPNLCFVDTLDNVGLHTAKHGTTADMFGRVSEENVARIRRQNSRRISVIIGNPPYNANQANENDNNKNREYPEIDKRIKNTYIAESTAQKTKLYDMYARFLRWASDRIDANGIIAFVSNSSFIDSRTFGGFRKVVAQEFNEIWIIDLKGNARTSGERRRREGGNIFDDQIRVGIAVYFLARKKGINGCRIFYEAVRDYAKSDEKREFLTSKHFSERKFSEVRPDQSGNWINLPEERLEGMLPLITKEEKSGRARGSERAILALYANGVKSNRDEWVYDFSPVELKKKVDFFYRIARQNVGRRADAKDFDVTIKWSRDLKLKASKGLMMAAENAHCGDSIWRPFVKKAYWIDKTISDILTDHHARLFGPKLDQSNRIINLPTPPISREYFVVGSSGFVEYHCVGDTCSIPRWVTDVGGEVSDNVTDWAIEQFRKRYEKGAKKPKRALDKEAIFHYVYGVLHDPVYREKYALNLKREFPRIPFYTDFWQWSDWGKTLMDLHIGYETVEPYKLKRIEAGPSTKPSFRKRGEGASERAGAPKPMLRADKGAGRIVLDTQTTLASVPTEAWDYKLGNRSALEWILDQYKEKKPKDPTIREKFDTYRFPDYKEKVIDLLMRVTRVSVETQAIVETMKAAIR